MKYLFAYQNGFCKVRRHCRYNSKGEELDSGYWLFGRLRVLKCFLVVTASVEEYSHVAEDITPGEVVLVSSRPFPGRLLAANSKTPRLDKSVGRTTIVVSHSSEDCGIGERWARRHESV